VVNNELPGKKNHNRLSVIKVIRALTTLKIHSMFYNPAFYPKAVGYKLTRQVFWLVLFICILPELLQWIWQNRFSTMNLQLRE
jgi:hypothetical protein